MVSVAIKRCFGRSGTLNVIPAYVAMLAVLNLDAYKRERHGSGIRIRGGGAGHGSINGRGGVDYKSTQGWRRGDNPDRGTGLGRDRGPGRLSRISALRPEKSRTHVPRGSRDQDR